MLPRLLRRRVTPAGKTAGMRLFLRNFRCEEGGS
jgi:hypothetical protein